MNRELLGNSRCRIELRPAEGIAVKSTSGGFPPDRLLRQGQKQADFFRANRDPRLATARILSSERNGTTAQLVMDYRPEATLAEFLAQARQPDLDQLAVILTAFVATSVKFSRAEIVDPETLERKYQSIRHERLEIDELWNAVRPTGPFLLPVGSCHGDLTLCNLLYQSDPRSGLQSLVLLDFLDTFLDAPLQDIVKLRQDTCHRWCCFRHGWAAGEIGDKLAYLDAQLVAAFAPLDWYRGHYVTFQFLNLLRIVPYAEDDATIEFLLKEMRQLCR